MPAGNHLVERIGLLRAAVLGDNDGIWFAKPWLPVQPALLLLAASRQHEDAGAVLKLYRMAIRIRQSCAALRLGSLKIMQVSGGRFVWQRNAHGGTITCACNFGDAAMPLAVGPGKDFILASENGDMIEQRGFVWLRT